MLSFVVAAGRHTRKDCPTLLQGFPLDPKAAYVALAEDGSRLPLQALTNDSWVFVLPNLAANKTAAFTIIETEPSSTQRVVISQTTTDSLTVHLNNALVTRYQYTNVKARPYFYPLLAPNDIPVTRSYPMFPDAPNEQRDHPHHRSLWIAFGEVNETDNWSEEEGHGRTEHQAFGAIESGDVFALFESQSLWTTAERKPLLNQRLQTRIWATESELRILDFEIDLTAAYGDVLFGDTKEGGILSVRVATELDVPRTGTITNTFGGINEEETWGKAAHWCDYSGTVHGASVGVAILDNPLSFRYPTHWHVRNYGLMTANPFGYSYYTDGAKNGSHILASGETLAFRYRLILHCGDCEQAQIRDRYLDYVAPPKVTRAQE